MGLEQFIAESNHIEGIDWYKESEVEASRWFLDLEEITLQNLNDLQCVFAPGMPLRDKRGMNVQVGGHVAPEGGPGIPKRLSALLAELQEIPPLYNYSTPFKAHTLFEALHPYMDGNGRTGRMLWAWHMKHQGRDPFLRPFLHTWYYQTLQYLAK